MSNLQPICKDRQYSRISDETGRSLYSLGVYVTFATPSQPLKDVLQTGEKCVSVCGGGRSGHNLVGVNLAMRKCAISHSFMTALHLPVHAATACR